MTAAVAYFRVSTQKQKDSGLGLEAQRETVERFAAHRGLELIGERIEAESGRKCDRPKLEEALAMARKHHAIIVVAKLDRLARDTEFILKLSNEANANGLGGFLFCDLPDVDATSSVGRMVLTIMASFAEFEARRLAERTKEGLAAAKARGVQLGAASPKYTGNVKRQAEADKFYRELWDRLGEECADKSSQQIADLLNERQYPTPSGRGKWHATTVVRAMRVLNPK